MYFPSGRLTFEQLDFNLQQRHEYWKAAGGEGKVRKMQFSLEPVCILLQLVWLMWEVVAICMCVHARVWLARRYRCKCGAAPEAFLSGLKHNQSFIWRPGEESVERGYLAIRDGQAYINSSMAFKYQPQENRNKSWWAQLRKASEILY